MHGPLLPVLLPVLLLPVLLLAACTAPGVPPVSQGAAVNTIELSEADDGKAIGAAPAQTVAVRLAENPGTGYGWRVLLQPEAPWQLVGTSFAPAPAGRAGAGGIRTWLLRAARPGKAHLRFDLRRPWGDDPPVKHLEFELLAE